MWNDYQGTGTKKILRIGRFLISTREQVSLQCMNLSEGTISADHAEDFRDFRRCFKLSHIYYTYATFSDADEGFYIVIQSPSSSS